MGNGLFGADILRFVTWQWPFFWNKIPCIRKAKITKKIDDRQGWQHINIFIIFTRWWTSKGEWLSWHVFPWAFSWSSQTCCGWLSWFLFFTWSQGTLKQWGIPENLRWSSPFFFFFGGGGPGLHYSSLKNKLSWLENEHGLKMYFLLNVRIFQPGILDYQKEGTSAISISGYCSYAMLCHWQTSGHEIVRTAELLVGALDLCIPFLSICLFMHTAYWVGMECVIKISSV